MQHDPYPTDETPPVTKAVSPADVLQEAQALAETPFITFDDIPKRDAIVPVETTLPTGKKVRVPVKRLTGDEACEYFKAARTAKADSDIYVLKLRTFLRTPDGKRQLFTDVQVREILREREAGQLAALLAAIHQVNPFAKND